MRIIRWGAALTAGLAIVATLVGLWIYRPISPTHPTLAEAKPPPLVPLRQFYADSSSRWRYQLSRDGKWLSWLESRFLKPALHVRPLDGDDTSIFHTDDVVRWYAWSADSRYLVYQADRDGWENDVIVSIDVTKPNAEPRSYDFGKDVKSFVVQIPDGAGSSIVMGHNGLDRGRFDLYRLNLASGDTEPIGERQEPRTWTHLTRKGDVFARTRTTEQGWSIFELKDKDRWIEKWRGFPPETFYPITPPREDGTLVAISNRARDTSALVSVNLATMVETVLDHTPDADYGSAFIDRETLKPLIGFSQPGYQRRHFFDDRVKALFTALNAPSRWS